MKIFQKLRLGILLAILFSLLFIFAVDYFKHPLRQATMRRLVAPNRDRILVLAPHPDDEVLGCAGIIQRAVKNGIPVKIAFLTYGDNNQWSFLIYRKHLVLMPKAVRLMGEMRRNEAIEASKTLGLPSENLIFLGYPDFKTLNIWYTNWGKSAPAKSMLTHVRAVPYQTAFRPGAEYKGEDILEDLKSIIRDFRPTKIFVSHPADHNPDHRSLYLFTRVALLDLESEIQPSLNPYLIHYKRWPKPAGYHPDSKLSPPETLASDISWKSNTLTADEIALKHLAIQKHHSQFISSPGYLLSFIRSPELFGDFPDILVRKNTSDSALTQNRADDLQTPPEELEDNEIASFVGIEERLVHIDNDCLVMSLALSRPLGKAVGLSVFAFGYRADTPFKDMPKIRIRFATMWHKVFDQRKQIKGQGIIIKRNAKKIVVRIPLDILGKPEKIFTSANTYLGAVPLDWVSWRILDLTENRLDIK